MKKITAFITALMLSLQLTTVFATGGAQITVGNVSGDKGETVSVTVDLSNCPEWTNVGLQYTFDSTVLTLVGVTNGAVGTTFTKSQTFSVHPYVTTWTAGENSEYNGTMATLQFKIADNAADGTYPIGVSFYVGKKGTYTDGNQVNYLSDLNTLAKTSLGLTYHSGSVTVQSVEPTLSATTTDGRTVSITATAGTMSGKIIATLYDGDRMVDCVFADAAESLNLTFAAKDQKGNAITGNKIKVMWWDGLGTLSPVCDPVEINAID